MKFYILYVYVFLQFAGVCAMPGLRVGIARVNTTRAIRLPVPMVESVKRRMPTPTNANVPKVSFNFSCVYGQIMQFWLIL